MSKLAKVVWKTRRKLLAAIITECLTKLLQGRVEIVIADNKILFWKGNV